MKFKVLGCSGSRIPGHMLTSYLINNTLLLDAGSVTGYLDVEGQSRITDILLSHSNLDHTKDLLFMADNLAGAVSRGEKSTVNLYSQPCVLESLHKHLFNDDIWPDFTVLPSPDNPVIRMEPIELHTDFSLCGVHVRAFPVPHAAGSTGYILFGEDPAEHVCVTGDTGPDGGWVDILNDMEFPITNLMVECSFPNELESLAKMSNHLTPRLLHKKVARLKVRPKLYITHIKAMYAEQVQEELKQELAGFNYHLTRKGDSFVF